MFLKPRPVNREGFVIAVVAVLNDVHDFLLTQDETTGLTEGFDFPLPFLRNIVVVPVKPAAFQTEGLSHLMEIGH
jgi:hypothetical protein